MGIFDFLKKKKLKNSNSKIDKPIPEEEKKYYQEDEYYQKTICDVSGIEKAVITFEERKQTAKPSKNGLYPAEILLLDYCEKGEYPEPKSGYPGFWWFEYGIRNVGERLKSLEERNYIKIGKAGESLKGLTVVSLKEILKRNDLPVSGKKANLIKRVAENISEEELIKSGVKRKYCLTDLGKDELKENEYVPYMHKNRSQTVETDNYKNDFNVWSINQILDIENKDNWKEIVNKRENEMHKKTQENYNEFMKSLASIDPDGYKELKDQDAQIAKVQKRHEQYGNDKDLKSYIEFWEELWSKEGLLFEGSGWMFLLPDLYIKDKRYEEALKFVNYIKQNKGSYYTQKADKYIEKINKKIEKQKNNA
mgnify:CR=1 FL=1|jgi:hypothetical protein